jgi:hypothetical protein
MEYSLVYRLFCALSIKINTRTLVKPSALTAQLNVSCLLEDFAMLHIQYTVHFRHDLHIK